VLANTTDKDGERLRGDKILEMFWTCIGNVVTALARVTMASKGYDSVEQRLARTFIAQNISVLKLTLCQFYSLTTSPNKVIYTYNVT
jgi:hypothetical protein